MTLDQVFHGEGVMGPHPHDPSPAGKKLLRKGFLTSGSGVGSLWTCSEHMPPLPRSIGTISFFPGPRPPREKPTTKPPKGKLCGFPRDVKHESVH